MKSICLHTTSNYIQRALEAYGNKFTYVNLNITIIVTCVTHGDFAMVAEKHTKSKCGDYSQCYEVNYANYYTYAIYVENSISPK